MEKSIPTGMCSSYVNYTKFLKVSIDFLKFIGYRIKCKTNFYLWSRIYFSEILDLP